MKTRFLLLVIFFITLSDIVSADSLAATNEHPDLNTNPELELYPGMGIDINRGIEYVSVNEIKELLEILTSLRNKRIEQATKILELKLLTSSKRLSRIPGISSDTREVLRQAEEYKKQYKIE